MKLKNIFYSFFFLAAISCSNSDESAKGKYLGEWKSPRGKASIQIYEENGGLFAKFSNGDIMPLKYQKSGQYYEGSTVFGVMPFIIRDDTLQYSQSKYLKSQK